VQASEVCSIVGKGKLGMNIRGKIGLICSGYVFVGLGLVELVIEVARISRFEMPIRVSIIFVGTALVIVGAVALVIAASLRKLEAKIGRAERTPT
jgi:hypothetical protein